MLLSFPPYICPFLILSFPSILHSKITTPTSFPSGYQKESRLIVLESVINYIERKIEFYSFLLNLILLLYTLISSFILLFVYIMHTTLIVVWTGSMIGTHLVP